MSATSASAAETLLRPLDVARRRVLAALMPGVRPLLVDRELRVAVAAVAIVLVAAATALALPLWLLAITPIVYGVPHLLADVRYLVVRPGLHRRRLLWLAAGVPLALAAVGCGAGAGLLAVGGACLVARTRPATRVTLAVAAVGLAVIAWRAGRTADSIFAHAHNFVAVLLWWAWRPRAGRAHLVPLALFVALTVGFLALPVEQLASLAGAPGGLDADTQIAWLAGDLAGALATRLMLCFAFAQAVHYGVWTRLIPDEDRARATPRGFAASYRALRDDFGRWPLVIVLAVAAALAGWALVDLSAARSGYFRLAQFHGGLELAAGALLLLEETTALIAWLSAFLFGQFFEVPIYMIGLRPAGRGPGARAAIGFGASTITHPVVWFVFPALFPDPDAYVMMAVICEVFAVVVEAVYARAFGIGWRRAIVTSLLANAASCGLGLASRAMFGWP